MLTLPAVPCINCQSEQIQVAAAQRQYEEGTDPPQWVTTTYHGCAQSAANNTSWPLSLKHDDGGLVRRTTSLQAVSAGLALD
jgi:hypothetical protein